MQTSIRNRTNAEEREGILLAGADRGGFSEEAELS